MNSSFSLLVLFLVFTVFSNADPTPSPTSDESFALCGRHKSHRTCARRRKSCTWDPNKRVSYKNGGRCRVTADMTASPTTSDFHTCGRLNYRQCGKSTDCTWSQKYCYVTGNLPTQKPTTADFHQCGRLSKSKCSRSRSCFYSKSARECLVATPKPTASPTTSSPTTTAFNTCGKLNHRKCKKTTGCTWLKPQCYVTADLPTPKPTTADFHKCGRLSKSKCSRSRSCFYSKAAGECLVKTASPTAPPPPTVPPTTPPPTTGHELHCSQLLAERSGVKKCHKSKYCKLMDAKTCIPDENAPLPTAYPTSKPTSPTPSPTFPPIPKSVIEKDYVVQAPSKAKDNKCVYPDQDFLNGAYGIICCDNDGIPERPVIEGTCPITSQWYNAFHACKIAGKRLCTPEEILELPTDDCYRLKKAWTSEECEGAIHPPSDAPSVAPTLAPTAPTPPPSSCDGLTPEQRAKTCASARSYQKCKGKWNSGIRCTWHRRRDKCIATSC